MQVTAQKNVPTKTIRFKKFKISFVESVIVFVVKCHATVEHDNRLINVYYRSYRGVSILFSD